MAQLLCRGEADGPTLLDGELTTLFKDSVTESLRPHVFLVFDVITHASRPVGWLSLTQRLELIGTQVRTVYKKERERRKRLHTQ